MVVLFQAGYAKSSQKGCGLHLRQFARAFIIEDDEGKNGLFVSVDVGMVGHGLRKEVSIWWGLIYILLKDMLLGM